MNTENEKKLSDKVLKVLKYIEKKNLTKKELINYYTNISNSSSVTNWEKEILKEEVELKLRTKFPKVAYRTFGGKSKKAQEILKKIFISLEKEFDWSENMVGSKVKICGDMLNGKEYVCWYISYKNDKGYYSELIYRQKTIKDKPILEVNFKRVGKEFKNQKKIDQFTTEFQKDAISLYKSYLYKVIK